MAALKDNTARIQNLLAEITELPKDRANEAYEEGYTEGRTDGYADGLAARTYEVWTITLVDGSVVEKEVALL